MGKNNLKTLKQAITTAQTSITSGPDGMMSSLKALKQAITTAQTSIMTAQKQSMDSSMSSMVNKIEELMEAVSPGLGNPDSTTSPPTTTAAPTPVRRML